MGAFSAVIVAGGHGARMKNPLPKQFLLVDGRPLLMETIEKFASAAERPDILLVLPEEYMATWNELVSQFKFQVPHRVMMGGATRAGSVVNGLKETDPESIVAIHDGVRPLVSTELISRCFQEASAHGTAIPVVPVKETLRELKDQYSVSLNRENFRLVQTPQCFRAAEILDCYMNASLNFYTDDAGIAEDYGIKIHLIDGEPANIKITTPEDLVMARAIMQVQKAGAEHLQ